MTRKSRSESPVRKPQDPPALGTLSCSLSIVAVPPGDRSHRTARRACAHKTKLKLLVADSEGQGQGGPGLGWPAAGAVTLESRGR